MRTDLDRLLRDPDRLAALHRAALLDTAAEPAFDRLTRAATVMVPAPIALVVLLDADRQFFKSSYGLAEPWASLRETPLSHSFCQHVLVSDAPLVIGDARQDPAFVNHQAVLDLHVVAYLGIPLRTPSGAAIGSFCVVDTQPRSWTAHDVTVLQELAGLVMVEIEERQVQRAHTAAFAQLTGELQAEINERRTVEAALRASEVRFRAIFESAAIGIALVDLQGRIIVSNAAFQQLLGYGEDALRGQHFTKVTHPDDLDADLALYTELIAGQRDHYQLDKRYLRGDGQVVWAHLTISLVRDPGNEPPFVLAIIEDITEHRRVATELAHAQRRQIESHEAAQLQLARDLHDSVVQQLLGVSYQIVGLHQQLGPGATQAALQTMRSDVLEAVTHLRHLIRELRPAGLEEFGLCVALDGYVAYVRRTAPPGGPRIDLDLDPGAHALPPTIALCLFRVAQEALRNALRHAQAQQITLQVHRTLDAIVLQVRDDGCGFQVPSHLSHLTQANHFGLVGMAEWVQLVGGHMAIHAQPGHGTEVIVRVPVEAQEVDHGASDSGAARR